MPCLHVPLQSVPLGSLVHRRDVLQAPWAGPWRPVWRWAVPAETAPRCHPMRRGTVPQRCGRWLSAAVVTLFAYARLTLVGRRAGWRCGPHPRPWAGAWLQRPRGAGPGLSPAANHGCGLGSRRPRSVRGGGREAFASIRCGAARLRRSACLRCSGMRVDGGRFGRWGCSEPSGPCTSPVACWDRY